MTQIYKIALLVFPLFLSQSATALTLSPVYYNSYSETGYCTVDCSSPLKTVYGLDSSIATIASRGSNSTTLSTSPSVSSYAEADLPRGNIDAKHFYSSGGGHARLVYDFEIAGPLTIQIPVLVEASATLKSTGGAYSDENAFAQSDAYFYLLQGNSQVISKHETAFYGVGSSGGVSKSDFSVDDFIPLTTNTDYKVQITVNSVASVQVAEGVTAINDLNTEAMIDPIFTIDPFYSKDYSIHFSEGLGASSVSPVPLPASFSMFGAAVVALGAFGYAVKVKKGVVPV